MGIHQSERGIALLRMFTGLWLLRVAFAHLYWAPWPWATPAWVQVTVEQLASHALYNPSFWVRYLIQLVLLPHAALYSALILQVQLVAGLSLALGLLTMVGAALSILLALAQGVLGYYAGDAFLGLYLFQGILSGVLLFTRAGRRWGMDAVLSGIRPRSWLW